MEDYRCAVKLVSELDGYGLDMFEFFGVMAFAKRLGEEGLIPNSELIPEVDLSSYPSLSIWAKKIAHREGLGRLLADGFQAIIEAVGARGADSAPALVKGMHPYTGPGSALPWNLFGTMELGQILDPRGPHVGSGGSPTYFAKRPMEVFPKHLVRMGMPEEELDRVLPAEGHGLMIGRLLRYSHRWFTILGSLGICARAQINRFYNAQLCADLYEAVTGIPTDLHGLRERADRAWTLLRMINVREGLRPESYEAFPKRWFQENGFKEYVSEEPLREEDARRMAEEYYEEWGWDPKTGVPTPQRLKELGLT
jgi:aldehyde:ferredoxin oxidoreductase